MNKYKITLSKTFDIDSYNEDEAYEKVIVIIENDSEVLMPHNMEVITVKEEKESKSCDTCGLHISDLIYANGDGRCEACQ